MVLSLGEVVVLSPWMNNGFVIQSCVASHPRCVVFLLPWKSSDSATREEYQFCHPGQAVVLEEQWFSHPRGALILTPLKTSGPVTLEKWLSCHLREVMVLSPLSSVTSNH